MSNSIEPENNPLFVVAAVVPANRAPTESKRSKLGQLALRSCLAALGIYMVSKVLTTYSGTSLLFPKSWREIVIGMASLLGVILFEAAHDRRVKHLKVDAEGEEHLNKSANRRLWSSLAVLVLSVCGFFLLRGTCVHHFDPTTWLNTQVEADYYRVGALPKEMSEMIDQKASLTARMSRASTQPNHDCDGAILASESIAKDERATLSQDFRDQVAKEVIADSVSGHESETGSSSAEKKHILDYIDSLTPEFVNREQKLICLPIQLPKEDQKYVDNQHELKHTDGIRVLLDEQPGTVINWLNGEARMNLHYTTLAFLLLYLLITGSGAYLLGLRFDPVKAPWEALFGIG